MNKPPPTDKRGRYELLRRWTRTIVTLTRLFHHLSRPKPKKHPRSSVSSQRPREKCCQAGENMGLIECHIEQTTKAPSPVMEVEQPERKNFIAEYENVFTGIGKLKGVTVKLHVVPGAPGTIQQQRRVSIPLKE